MIDVLFWQRVRRFAIRTAKERFEAEKLEGDFRVGDIMTLPFTDAQFDAAIDIASVQHNTPPNIGKIVDEIYRVLRPGGRFFGMMIAENKGSFV